MPTPETLLTPTALLWRRVMGAERLISAIVVVIALIFRFQWSFGWVQPEDFFAYLTIQSNIAYALVAGYAGVSALRGALPSPRLDAVRAGVLTCTVTAGIVFAAIVQQSAVRGIRVDVPWSDVLLHFVLPMVAIADWMLTPRSRVRRSVILFVLAYVGVWGAATMIRGSITGWYPYYFLDPNQTDGPAEFLLLSGIAVAVFVVVGLTLVAVRPPTARRRRERMARDSSGP